MIKHWEVRELYEDMLDDCYGPVEVAGMTYDTSRLLKEADPVAFRCGMLDYVSSLLEDGLITEEVAGLV